MELTIALLITMINCVLGVATFVLNRKDKAIKDAKEVNMGLIEYRLNELDKNVQKILDKLDTYDAEIDNRIEKAIEVHIKEYHKKG